MNNFDPRLMFQHSKNVCGPEKDQLNVLKHTLEMQTFYS